jgi:hypothetical protein
MTVVGPSGAVYFVFPRRFQRGGDVGSWKVQLEDGRIITIDAIKDRRDSNFIARMAEELL